jgi:hypothetical protein
MDCKTRTKSPAMLLAVASLFCFAVGIASAQNPPDKMKGNMGNMPGMTGNMPMDGACPMMGGAGGAQHQ